MAVEDKYAVGAVESGDRFIATQNRGDKPVVSQVVFEVAAADSDGSKYRVLKGIPTTYRIANIEICNDAITGSTDWDLGFYETDKGDELDKDLLMDGEDLSSANAIDSPVSGISNVDIADAAKPIYELLGLTHGPHREPTKVDLVLTANTVGSADGTVYVKATLLPPVV